MSGRILLVNGPNLNLLGTREPEFYGTVTLESIVGSVKEEAARAGYTLEHFQSNSEGDIVSFIQAESPRADGMLLNAGAYTHTSIAIRDAVGAMKIPFVEIHISNVFARERFRQHSVLSDIAVGIVAGFGASSYHIALQGLIDFIVSSRARSGQSS